VVTPAVVGIAVFAFIFAGPINWPPPLIRGEAGVGCPCKGSI
jgi:hypothetical protein